ncbi:MAG: (d)CMP kinase [Actinophytocola sp.]|nr:(d)CMP kinase [Actinophytocola sp.]
MVAIDGPSGTGKSTAARGLAERLGAGYLDTGAMYRVITLAVLRAGTDLGDPAAIAKVAGSTDLAVGADPVDPVVLLDDADVGAEIRGDEVTAAVSAVAAVPEVRELLVDAQRQIIEGVLADVGGIVVEGRDIGTVVVPDAELKVFLTAAPEIRAARRTAQHSAAGRAVNHTDVLRAVDRRDRLDSTRAADPLRAAADAVEVDTSELDLERVITALLELVAQRDLVADRAREG